MAADLKKIQERFPLSLDLTFLEDDEFYLLGDFVYKSPAFGDITCPETYLTDGASIPHLLQILVGSPWSGKFPRAAVIHDWLCSSEGEIIGTDKKLTKKEADLVFLEMLEFLGVPSIKSHIMYWAVRSAKRIFEWENKQGQAPIKK